MTIAVLTVQSRDCLEREFPRTQRMDSRFRSREPPINTMEWSWGTTCLDDITIWGGDAGTTIEMTYSFDWHSEHTFGVRIADSKVSGISIDG